LMVFFTVLFNFLKISKPQLHLVEFLLKKKMYAK